MAVTNFGDILRRRRQQLRLTQHQVARQVGVRANYVGYLERDLRRPSTAVLVRLAKALGLDREDLFFRAHPNVRAFMRSNHSSPGPEERPGSAWDGFRADQRLRKRHRITAPELRVLAQVSKLGEIRRSRDYLFILQAIRQALQDD